VWQSGHWTIWAALIDSAEVIPLPKVLIWTFIFLAGILKFTYFRYSEDRHSLKIIKLNISFFPYTRRAFNVSPRLVLPPESWAIWLTLVYYTEVLPLPKGLNWAFIFLAGISKFQYCRYSEDSHRLRIIKLNISFFPYKQITLNMSLGRCNPLDTESIPVRRSLCRRENSTFLFP
jgi:hypothetical protein